MNCKIRERIEESKKSYPKKVQKAEILKRNVSFRNHWLEAYSEVKNHDVFFANLKKLEESEKNNKLPDYIPLKTFPETYSKWSYFCFLWGIRAYWNGKPDTLEDYIKSPATILFCARPDFPNSGYISIEIDAWTTLNDIRLIWPEIEKYQKTYLKQKIELRTHFGRDLCWYDLYHKSKCSLREIIKLWVSTRPDDIDLLVIRRLKRDQNFIQSLKDRIKETSELQKFKGKSFKDEDFLAEIKEGELARYFLPVFEEEKEFYISGKTKHGKFTPPFLKTIEQAVKRMEEFINQYYLEYVSEEFKLLEGVVIPDYESWDKDSFEKIILSE